MGHSVLDGDVAARAILTAANASRRTAACSRNSAAFNDDSSLPLLL